MKILIVALITIVMLVGCTEQIKLDVNNDGLIDVSDILYVGAYINNMYDVDIEDADVNKDGVVNDADKQLIREYIRSI